MEELTILVADNSPVIRNALCSMLEEKGYKTIGASNPVEAQKILEEQKIDIALLDLRLINDDDDDDDSGLILAKTVAPSVPKIICTGYPTLEHAREALKIQLKGIPYALDFLAKPFKFEVLQTSIKRVFMLHKHFKELDEKNMFRILFLAANPMKTYLKLDEEVKAIHNNLKSAKERDKLILEQEWAVTTDTLMQAVLDESPNIIHFSGHGQQEGIILENEMGEPKIVNREALAYLFELFKDSVKCVVLNSCYSEEQAKAIKSHIPYVIGMKSAISDKAAISFSTGFYKAIGAGRDIPFAFKLGIAAIKLEGVSGDDIPILM